MVWGRDYLTKVNLELDLELDILRQGEVINLYARCSACEWPTNVLRGAYNF